MEQQIGQWIAIGIITMAYAIEKALKIVNKKNNKMGNNPFPCKENTRKINEVDRKLDDACERISRIEGRLNNRK